MITSHSKLLSVSYEFFLEKEKQEGNDMRLHSPLTIILEFYAFSHTARGGKSTNLGKMNTYQLMSFPKEEK